MIKSFKDRETERIFNRHFSRKLPHDIQPVALRKLRMLNRAASLNELRIPPNNRLKKMAGERNNQFSIRINDQWRITFIWLENNAEEVQIVDYH